MPGLVSWSTLTETPEAGNRVCFARSDSGIEKAEDLFTRELIVAGTGVPRVLSLILGSVASALVRTAPCPVVVVRAH